MRSVPTASKRRPTDPVSENANPTPVTKSAAIQAGTLSAIPTQEMPITVRTTPVGTTTRGRSCPATTAPPPSTNARPDEQRPDLGLAEEAVEMERQNALDDPEGEDGEEHDAAGDPEAGHAQGCAIGEEHPPLGREGEQKGQRDGREHEHEVGARTAPAPRRARPAQGPITLPTE